MRQRENNKTKIKQREKEKEKQESERTQTKAHNERKRTRNEEEKKKKNGFTAGVSSCDPATPRIRPALRRTKEQRRPRILQCANSPQQVRPCFDTVLCPRAVLALRVRH